MFSKILLNELFDLIIYPRRTIVYDFTTITCYLLIFFVKSEIGYKFVNDDYQISFAILDLLF